LARLCRRLPAYSLLLPGIDQEFHLSTWRKRDENRSGPVHKASTSHSYQQFIAQVQNAHLKLVVVSIGKTTSYFGQFGIYANDVPMTSSISGKTNALHRQCCVVISNLERHCATTLTILNFSPVPSEDHRAQPRNAGTFVFIF
jgi:hypothetical protein